MSKKRRTRKQKINYQEGKLVKIKELEKLRMEIIELDREIKNQKKIKPIRNLKIFGVTCRKLIAPFVLITSLTVGAGAAINVGLPFKKDNIPSIKNIKVEYETDKPININESYIKSYGVLPSPKEEGLLKIYFPYKLNDSNKYEQLVRTYELSHSEKEQLYEAILNNNIEDSITNLEEYKEKVKIIDEIKETNDDYIVKCNLTFIDESNKLYVKETSDANTLVSILEIIIISLLNFMIIDSSKINSTIKKINRQYKIISLKELNNELEYKKQKHLELKKEYKL